MSWDAVIFDLDDTLYPEHQFVSSGMLHVANWIEMRLGPPASRTEGELSAILESDGTGKVFDTWLASNNYDSEHLVDDMVREYRQHTPTLTPFPEMANTLARLSKSCPLGLVSDGYGDVQRRKLLATGLEKFFQAIVFSDDLGRDAWKPSLRPFQLVLQRLSVRPQNAVYVADNPLKDFIGPRQLGMASIRIRYREGVYSAAEPATESDAPDAVIPDCRKLEKTLARLSADRHTRPTISPNASRKASRQ